MLFNGNPEKAKEHPWKPIDMAAGLRAPEASLRIRVLQDLKGTQMKFRPGFNLRFR